MRGIGAVALATALLGGCAIGDGEHFGELSPHLVVALDDSRAIGDGWHDLSSSYELRLDRLTLTIEEAALVASAAGGAAFDPANPPPGYSLCHNGHCHAADGSLVDYEDIEAMLAGGEGATTVAILPIGEVDVLAGVDTQLTCEPACELGRADIGLVRLDVVAISAEGRIRDGRTPARIDGELSWSLSLAPEEPPLVTVPIELPLDRSHDPEVDLGLVLEPGPRLFDAVDWAGIAAGNDDGLVLGDDPVVTAAILAAISALEVEVSIVR